MKKEFDIAIIGSGPAGLSASIYASRAGFKTAVFGNKLSSRLYLAHTIENLLGFPEGIEGSSLLEKGILQSEKFGTSFEDHEVINIIHKGNDFILKTAEDEYASRTIIFATGVQNKTSEIEGEQDFAGKGIAFCVTCDGSFFKDKKVGVIGEGDFAAEEALELLDFTDKVEILLNGKESQINKDLMRKIEDKKIKLIRNGIKRFYGENKLKGILMEDGEEKELDGVFIALGLSSSFKLASKIQVDTKNNFIITDENGKTNIDGVFAAGDVTGKGMQVSTAIGGGARAAMSATSYIKEVTK